jgi:mono/diheme cytochrome c family protein
MTICVLALAGCASSTPERLPAATISAERGGDLYRETCNACHTAQVHWRDKRLVKTWDELRFQVSRWQGISGLSWSTQEIDDVAAYLNRTFYDMPCPQPGCGSAGLSSRQIISPALRPSRSALRRIS